MLVRSHPALRLELPAKYRRDGTSVRVVNKQLQCIGYRLNLLGVRVYRRYAQLVARSGGEWVTIGPPRELPIEVPSAVTELGSDTLLLTAYQYCQENPGTDLKDVLSRRKDFDAAIADQTWATAS